jgi:hypothetical protein
VAHEFSFSDVASPSQHFCLTLPLRDFSIGHRIIFMHQRNPLVFGDEAEFNKLPDETRIFWLIESVTVCNQSYADRVALEKSPTAAMLKRFAKDSKSWRKEREKSQAAYLKQADNSLSGWWAAETAEFRNYLSASRIITDFKSRRDPFPFLPCASVPDAKGRTFGAPYEAQLIQFLIRSRLCVDTEAAMEYPFALAEMHYLTYLEREGALQIMNYDDLAHKERMAKIDLDAAHKAGFQTVEEHVDFIVRQAKAAKEKQAAKAESSDLASEIPAELKGTS